MWPPCGRSPARSSCNSALAVAAGKRPFVEDGAIRNLFDTRDDAAKLAVATEMAQALTSGRFDAVFLTDFEVPSMARLLEPKYQLTRVENLGEQHFGFFPNRLYVRKDLLPAP